MAIRGRTKVAVSLGVHWLTESISNADVFGHVRHSRCAC